MDIRDHRRGTAGAAHRADRDEPARGAQRAKPANDLRPQRRLRRGGAGRAVKVIILAGNGPHFSSGHDLRPGGKNAAGVDFPPVGNWGGFAEPNAHGRFAREQEIYLQITRRWRNLAKPTIAEVHGKCIAGGLMLAWACDLIVASSDAEFCDPVVTMGVCGVEWFVHPWELGPRKAKELLFTADVWNAEEAHRLGMVNHVVPRPELSSFVMALAQKIAAKPSFALKLTKEAVNRSVDVMGQPAAIEQAFALHQLCHAHNLQEFGMVVDPAGLHPSVRKPAGSEVDQMDLTLSDEQRLLRESADRFVSETYNADHRRKLANDPHGFSADDLEAVRRSRLAGAADRRGLWRARWRRRRDRHLDGSVRARPGLRTLSLHRRDRRSADIRMRQRNTEAGAVAESRRRLALSCVRAFGARGALRSGRCRHHGAENA